MPTLKLKASLFQAHSLHIPVKLFVTWRKKEIDYIVMGNRGVGLLRRTFLGSTSDFVLHHAHLPVTIIPPQPKQNSPGKIENEHEGVGM